jgi:hypothetical protein
MTPTARPTTAPTPSEILALLPDPALVKCLVPVLRGLYSGGDDRIGAATVAMTVQEEWFPLAAQARKDELRAALERLDEAFNRLWSNGPVIDTIADWGRTWTSDADHAFYDLLNECRDAVRAALLSGEPEAGS